MTDAKETRPDVEGLRKRLLGDAPAVKHSDLLALCDHILALEHRSPEPTAERCTECDGTRTGAHGGWCWKCCTPESHPARCSPEPTDGQLAISAMLKAGFVAPTDEPGVYDVTPGGLLSRAPEPTEDDREAAEKYLRKLGRGGFPTAADERERAFLAGCKHVRVSTRSPDETEKTTVQATRAMEALRNGEVAVKFGNGEWEARRKVGHIMYAIHSDPDLVTAILKAMDAEDDSAES